jgi:hypothetical protein
MITTTMSFSQTQIQQMIIPLNVSFKFSKLPWVVNECVRAHLTCAVGVVGIIKIIVIDSS